MKKIIILSIITVITLAVTITIFQFKTKSETPKSSLDDISRVALAIDKAVSDLGYEYSGLGMEQFLPAAVYTDDKGNEIVYNQYHSTEPERIKSGEALFFTNVFDPTTVEIVHEMAVNGEKAMLCEKDGRAYLIWNPNENTILMLDYDPNAVSIEEIIMMAESCH